MLHTRFHRRSGAYLQLDEDDGAESCLRSFQIAIRYPPLWLRWMDSLSKKREALVTVVLAHGKWNGRPCGSMMTLQAVYDVLMEDGFITHLPRPDMESMKSQQRVACGALRRQWQSGASSHPIPISFSCPLVPGSSYNVLQHGCSGGGGDNFSIPSAHV